MAIRPDYQTGTIDLVASSTDFTTTGAALQMVAVQPGDAIITPSGHVLIIATITGQNSGTLFLPCPAAAAGTDLPLRIRFQPDGSRYQGAVRNLIDLLSSGNVEAFAALVGSAGMIPIFTGTGTLDLADPATFGIQDPNGSLGKLAALTLDAENNKQLIRGDGTLGGEVFGTSENGGCLWPNGELEQWGVVSSLDSGGGAVITYPRAFSAISIFIPVVLTDWVSATFAPMVYQDWGWGSARLTSQVVWCRRADTGEPLLVGNVRWYARGKA